MDFDMEMCPNVVLSLSPAIVPLKSADNVVPWRNMRWQSNIPQPCGRGSISSQCQRLHVVFLSPQLRRLQFIQSLRITTAAPISPFVFAANRILDFHLSIYPLIRLSILLFPKGSLVSTYTIKVLSVYHPPLAHRSTMQRIGQDASGLPPPLHRGQGSPPLCRSVGIAPCQYISRPRPEMWRKEMRCFSNLI